MCSEARNVGLKISRTTGIGSREERGERDCSYYKESSFDGVKDCSHAPGIAAIYACRRIRKVTPLLLLPTAGNPLRDASAHQRHEPAAAGDFELPEDRVKVLFHRGQTQPGVISDLLVTPTIADKSDKFLFATRKPNQMRQT